jgi:hypothetical protein
MHGQIGRRVGVNVSTKAEVDAERVKKESDVDPFIEGMAIFVGSLFTVWKIASAVL